jgi:prephenate dehydrogenase
MRSVAIAGVGLIGGSFGLALRKAGFAGTIVGVSSPPALAEALARGAIDREATLSEAAECDLVYLAQPVGRIIDTLRHLDEHVRPETLVTDAGSTKEAIVDTASQFLKRCQFLGGHPMAGKETRGAAEAEADLFRGRPYVLTPCAAEEMRAPAARALQEWIRKIGAVQLIMTPEEHDRAVAAASHVPQLASTALASWLPASAFAVAGPGLADMVRLGASSYDVWRDILATNAGNISRALDEYIDKLQEMRDHLRDRELQKAFEAAAVTAAKIRRGNPA